MFVWSYIGLIECLFVGFIFCQDSYPASPNGIDQNEPDANVNLIIDTQPKSSDTDAKNNPSDNQTPELFACYECINCNSKSDSTINNCEFGINMCYTMHKRINNTSRIIRRGCTTSRDQCIVPNDGQINSFDSVTCCTSHKCNQGIQQFQPLFLLLIFSLIFIINI